jgi:ABC-type Fe3+ transport system substrate-binding protein
MNASGQISRNAALRGVAALGLALGTTSTSAAADRLSDIVEAAKAERELSLVAGADLFGGAPGFGALNDAFNKRFKTDVRISLTPGPSMTAMGSRLVTEYKGNRAASTGVYIGPISQFVQLDREGVLQRVDWTGTFPWVPRDAVLSTTGTGLLVFTGPNAIVYNPKLLAPAQAPKRFEDLVDPRMTGAWSKRLAIPPYPDFLAALTLLWDVDRVRDFAQKLVAVSAGTLRYGEAQPLIDGQFSITANVASALDMKWIWAAKGVTFNVVFGSNPAYSDYFQLGVPKNSPSPNLAQLFTAFMVTPEAQAISDRFGSQASHLVAGTRINAFVKTNRLRLIDARKVYDLYAAPGTAALYSEFGKILLHS